MSTRYYGVQNEVKAYCNRLQNETSIVVTPSVLKTLNDRVESLKRSGVWSQFGLGFNDVDGDAYLSRASVTDVIGRAEVLWFTRGIKSLGLWNNMVSWPLRSYQNTGTGSTVRSLGGLGTFDGAMVNSPTWGSNGINTSPIGSVVNFGAVLNSLVLNDFQTYMNIFQKGAAVATGNIWDSYGTPVIGLATRRQQLQIISTTQLRQTHNGYGGITLQTINSNFNSTLGYFRTTQAGPTNYGFDSGLALNGGNYVTDSVINQVLAIGDYNSIQTSTGIDITHSFMAIFPKTNIANFSPLNTLYRSTLGNGLGLP